MPVARQQTLESMRAVGVISCLCSLTKEPFIFRHLLLLFFKDGPGYDDYCVAARSVFSFGVIMFTQWIILPCF